MKKTIFTLVVISCCFLHCEKDTALSNGFSKTVGAGGSMARFAIVGNYLYAVDENYLQVFDITNAGAPVSRNKLNVGFEIETIFPFKDKLFIGSTSMIHIFNISDPVNPVKLSEAVSPTVIRRCDPVVAKDTVAYATLRSNGPCGGVQSVLSSIDIRDVTHPVEKSTFVLPEPFGLGYANDVLYVCDGVMGLILFDISDAYHPQQIKYIQDGKYIDVIPYGGVLICWVEGGVIIYDISDNKNPLLLSKIN
ncbi:MAG TPA: hypothetical protein VM012_15615 [Flavitalea sp.]|nr:hypothetical protein [Flavitalea sp.]